MERNLEILKSIGTPLKLTSLSKVNVQIFSIPSKIQKKILKNDVLNEN